MSASTRSSKAALSNYNKALSKEVSAKGVRVVRVSSGCVETNGAVGLVEKIARQMRKIVMDSPRGIPIGRPAKPTELGGPSRVARIAASGFHY
jgi:NAD(P)-dependent dehydrogenase (short-subunit alcohol dehydrogenase family)